MLHNLTYFVSWLWRRRTYECEVLGFHSSQLYLQQKNSSLSGHHFRPQHARCFNRRWDSELRKSHWIVSHFALG